MNNLRDLKFKAISFPGIFEKFWIPIDLDLKLPEKSGLPIEQQHFLLYIPWDKKYLNLVPDEYRDFFLTVFPYLDARTTNVHTAISLNFLDKLVSGFKNIKINRRIIAVALILHDSGWSKLSNKEIAKSLGVTGLKLTKDALTPKEKHAIEGKKIASRILSEYKFSPPLTIKEIKLIEDCVLYHDKPEEIANRKSVVPVEMQIMIDLDHIWSFTYENFWQDTIRKGVKPIDYCNNLTNDLGSYFVTIPGKSLAKKFIKLRKAEVEVLYKGYADKNRH